MGTAAGKELIYEAIPAIMAEIPSIYKDRRNDQQNYSFRGIDDVYNAVNPILAKHGVFMRAEVLDLKREERPSRSGGIMAFVQVRVRYSFVARDGSSVVTDSLGEGMDSGDKATPKAMSIAQKYAILQMFCIPTADAKDPEGDNPSPAPKGVPVLAPAPKPAPALKPAPKPEAPAEQLVTAEEQDVLIDIINRKLEAEGVNRQRFLGWLFGVQHQKKPARNFVGMKFNKYSLHAGSGSDLVRLTQPGVLEKVLELFKIQHAAGQPVPGAGPAAPAEAQATDVPYGSYPDPEAEGGSK